jgi:ribose 5-phosphate isomerase B
MQAKGRLALASDHAGVGLKARVLEWATASGFLAIDCGPASTDPVDYPAYAKKVTQAICDGRADAGILVCGSGIGMAMAANRVRGIRAAPCTSSSMAELSRRHNDANVLCLGARLIDESMALEIARVFLSTDFEGGRHEGRIRLLDEPVP